ncbi:MAG: hypothetical protein JW850_06570 [Thermoflexales bacterium]|nr:hypothetical protein [Thermoflexales bacterium]
MRRITWIIIGVLAAVVVVGGGAWVVLARRGQSAAPALSLAEPVATGTTLAMAPLAAAAPTPIPTVAVPGNLLTNPSFEGNFVTWGSANNVALGWKSWYLALPPCEPWKVDCWIPCPSNCIDPDTSRCKRDYGCFWQQPEFAEISYDPYTYRIHTGSKAQKYFSFSRMHQGGIYQQVTNVAPGTMLELSAWMQAWMCYDPDATGVCKGGLVSNAPSEMHLKIGLDPTGGTDPFSTNIMWSEEKWAFDQWVQYSVQSTALSDTVTVFTHSRPEWDWARINNDVYVDDAKLVAITPNITAEFVTIQPPQPELGQATSIQVRSEHDLSNTRLTITDPLSVSIQLGSGAMASSGPYTWTWTFTPTTPGSHSLVFSADTLARPATATLRAVATAHLSAQPSPAWLGQEVAVQASAYRCYYSSILSVTTPSGAAVALSLPDRWDEADLCIREWRFTSTVAGLHLITYTASLLESPITASVSVLAAAGARSFPPAPPISTPVTLQLWAYYPYTNVVVVVSDPRGLQSTSNELKRGEGTLEMGVPIVWEWVFTPTIAGAHWYTFTTEGLEWPVSGSVFVGGQAVYLPVVVKNGR